MSLCLVASRDATKRFEAVRQAGFSDGEIAEIVAHVALNVFTNYFNTATQVDVDFSKVALRRAA
jgi:alkylhydroperoxidase family enzyme